MTKWTCGKDREGDGEEKDECKEEQIWASPFFFFVTSQFAQAIFRANTLHFLDIPLINVHIFARKII